MEDFRHPVVAACRRAWKEAASGKVLLAVSGGADSTALLLACSLAGLEFDVAHCNFNLRGEESLRDAAFVEDLCKKFSAKLHTISFDTAHEARQGESTEMTCRRLRYDFFDLLRSKQGYARIVLAHNADDNIETFFLNALRGCGSRGLKAMEADTGILLRPLLEFSRKEILEFLAIQGQDYIVDSSNLASDYRRNYLRNEVFPMLESRWGGFGKAISTTIDIQQREHHILEHFISKALGPDPRFLSWEALQQFPDPETLIYRFISQFGGAPSIAREMALSAAEPQTGKRWIISAGVEAVFGREGIKILDRDSGSLPAPSFFGEKVAIKDVDFNKIKKAPLREVYLPADREYFWTTATNEMKIKPLGMKGSQYVWKILKDAGITVPERVYFPVLLEKSTQEPVWVPGLKRSRLFLVNPDTPLLLHITTP